MYHTKKIGVFISHIFGDYQQKLCQGIFDEASEYGYQVEIFSSTDGENPNTLVGEESILRVASCQEFDGIIYVSATYLETKLAEKIRHHLTNSVSCPVLYINQDSQIADNVLLDNHSPFAELAEHFIHVHKSRRICFLGCLSEPESSKERIEIFEHTLQNNRIQIGTNDIMSCNYGVAHMKEAWHFFCENGRPDAIMCYNDRMALDLMYALHEEGVSVPRDIAISGCDNLPVSENITPTLTTITFPTYELGKEAVQRLVRMIDGIYEQKPSVVKAITRIGCSCGCNYRESSNPYYAIQQMHDISKKERRIYEDIHMATALQEVMTLEDGMDLVWNYIPYIPHCRELYICLYEDWDSTPKQIQLLTSMQNFVLDDTFEEETYDENTINLSLGYCCGKEVQPCSFLRKDILPSYLMQKTDSHYICAPLYFEDHAFGYVVLAFEDNSMHYDFHITSWVNNVSRMLKRITDRKQMSLLINRLEDIYIRDELTGLYNHRGFHAIADILLEDALQTGSKVFAASFDIDGLKEINEKFGHAEGNFVIQVVAGALQSSADDSIVIARTGGDEFIVLAAGFEQSDANNYLDHIQNYLNNYNRLHRKTYDISVSFGSALSQVSNADELDTLIRNADQALVQKIDKN